MSAGLVLVGAVVALLLANAVWKRGESGLPGEAFEVEHDFAPDEAEPENPDLGEERWQGLYPDPAPMSLLALPLDAGAQRHLLERQIVMGKLESCSRVLLALHGRGQPFAGAALRVFQHYVQHRNVAVVAPVAPMPGRQWFVLNGGVSPERLPGWSESLELVGGLLRALQALGKPVVVLGFSQGGAIASAAAFRAERSVEALVLCSSYIVSKVLSQRAVKASSARVVVLHAPRDPVVPFAWGRASAEAIQKAGGSARFVQLAETHSHKLLSDELVATLDTLL